MPADIWRPLCIPVGVPLRQSSALLLACALLSPLVIPACGSSTTTSVTEPSTTRCEPTVTGSGTTFGPSGGSGTVSVGISRECSWSASAEAAWIALTGTREGQGDGSVAFRVGENADPIPRRGAITVSGARVDVIQDAAPCRFDVGRPRGVIASEGGQTGIGIGTHQACAWSAASDSAWAVVIPAAGRGSAEVAVRAGANSGPERRASLTIAGTRVEVTQAGVAPPSPPAPNPPSPPQPPPPPPPPPSPPPPLCQYEASPGHRNVGSAGTIDSFRVRTGTSCSWTAPTSAAWISILSGASGTGEGDVRYLVAPNLVSSGREGTISVGSASHRITQSGVPDDDDDDDDDDGGVRVSGRVEGLSGSCPALRFTVRGSVVVTSAQTDFRRGGCRDVRNGLDVTVDGTRRSDDSIEARRVELGRE